MTRTLSTLFLVLVMVVSGLVFLFSGPMVSSDQDNAVTPGRLDELWNRTWDAGPGEHSGLSAIAVDRSAVYVAGRTNRSDGNCDDSLLLKCDRNGTVLWKRSWGGVYGEESSALSVGSSGIIVGGHSYDRSSRSQTVFILGYDLDGNLLWNGTWAGPGHCYVRGIATGPSAVYLVGESYDNASRSVAFVLSARMDGTVLWNRTMSGAGNYSARCVAADSSGVYVAGEINDHTNLSVIRSQTDSFFCKLSPVGDPAWNLTVSGPPDDRATCLALSDEALYIGGDRSARLDFGSGPQPMSGAYRYDATLLKCSLDGRILWNRTFETGRSNYMMELSIKEPGVVAAGRSSEVSRDCNECFILHYDGDGGLAYNTTSPVEHNYTMMDMAYSPSGLFVTGYVDYHYWTTWYYPPFVIKVPLGEGTAWELVSGGGFTDAGRSASLGRDGIYACGVTDSLRCAGTDALVLKLDRDGMPVWNRTWGGYGEDEANGIWADSSGVYVAGGENGVFSGKKDAFLLKYDLDGELLWNRTWGGTGDDYANDVCVHGSAVYVTGTTDPPGMPTSNVAFVLKYDSDGRLLWARTWGLARFSIGRGVAADSSGVYVTGETDSSEGYRSVILRYSHDGELLWERIWAVASAHDSYSSSVTCANGIYVTGYAYRDGSFIAFLARYDAAGNGLWSGTWGARGDVFAYDVVPDAGCVVVASTGKESGTGIFNITLRRYRTSGELVSEGIWNGSAYEYGRALVADSSGICVIGHCGGSQSDVLAVKFDDSALPARRPATNRVDPVPTLALVLFVIAAVALVIVIRKKK